MEDVRSLRPKGYGVRHTQTLLLFLGMVLCFSMRVNMSMAIVDMTDKNNPSHFDWTPQTQATILSSFFWGYIILQLPGGELAKWLGGKRLIAQVFFTNSAISLCLPFLAYLGWEVVCACRILQGLSQSVLYTSLHHLLSQWIPFEEKGTLCTIVYAGGQLGMALQLIVSGFMIDAWGWQSIFYWNAGLGLILVVFYLIFGAESPERSSRIKQEEVIYIQKSLGREGELKRTRTPWCKIMTSLPFWAVIIAHCGQNWGFYTLMTEMPTYFSKVLNVNVKSNGIFTSLPYIAMYVLSFPLGFMTDYILKKNWLSVSNTRKLSNSIGHWGPAIALIAVSYSPPGNTAFAVAMLTTAVGLNAGQYTGFMLVHTDLAPNYAGVLMGVTNFAANVISIVAPLYVGAIVHDQKNVGEWRVVFFTAAGVFIFVNLFFLVFSTSKRQPWNDPPETASG